VLVLIIPYGVWLVIAGSLATELLTLIYGPVYSSYAVLAILLLVRATIEAASSPLAAALQTLERADVVTASLVLGAAITLGMGVLLIQNMGLNGAGIAAATSSLATAFWRWLMLRKILRREVRIAGDRHTAA
jgi:O-antigen/teichoic acid export membrane protein